MGSVGAFLSQANGISTPGASMRRAVLSLALPVLLVNAAAAIAQDTTVAPIANPPAAVTVTNPPLTQAVVDSSILGPSRDGLRAGVQSRTSARPDQPLMAPNQAGLGESRAMMIVGGAALVVGAVIGGTPGTLIMVGGAVVGLAGLYKYLQ
jgi:hypothetical protein